MNETPQIDSPYVGLMPYSEEHAPFFFGREREREIITANLMASRLTLLYGESGVGKSSVLRAGVVHHLREAARRNRTEYGRPEFAVVVFSSWRDDPLDGLANRIRESVAEARDEQTPVPVSGSLADRLQVWTERLDGDLLIILDQFEEYFLYHGQEEGEGAFAVEFPRAVNRPDLRVNFLISLREDALAKLDRFKGRIPNLFDNYLRIDHLDLEAARLAIEKPVEQFNRMHAGEGSAYQIEPALEQAVLEQVKTGQVLLGTAGRGVVDKGAGSTSTKERVETPFLQLVMTRLWHEEIDAGSRLLRRETLDRLGGAERIVRTHLDAVMSTQPPDVQDIAARVFHHLVTASGTKIAHTAPDLAEYARLPLAAVTPVLETLSSGDVRILRPVAPPPDQPGQTRYEIFHDVLAAAILDWRTRYAQVREKAEAEQRAEEQERRAKEQERRAEAEARAARRFRHLAAAMAVVSTLAVAAAGYAIQQGRVAAQREEQARMAETEAREQRTLAEEQTLLARRHSKNAEESQMVAEKERKISESAASKEKQAAQKAREAEQKAKDAARREERERQTAEKAEKRAVSAAAKARASEKTAVNERRRAEKLTEKEKTTRREAEEKARQLKLALQEIERLKPRTVQAASSSAIPVVALDYSQFGRVPENTIGISGSRTDQVGFEDKGRGNFSVAFQEALRDTRSDRDGDGRITLQEAFARSRAALDRQTPVMVGDGSSVALFSLGKASAAKRPQGKLIVLLVGISKYPTAPLQGAVSDVLAFRDLLTKHTDSLLAKDVVSMVLTDEQATLDNIKNALDSLDSASTPDDLVFFYFAGHETKLPDPAGRPEYKYKRQIAPYDFDLASGKFLAIPEVVALLGRVKAKHRVIILDV